jgi:hypothetical protein
MGTTVEITVVSEEGQGKQLVAEAFQEMDRLEAVFSERRSDSEVSAINRMAGKEAVRVGPEVLELIRRSLYFSCESDGAFDITWAALRHAWDFSQHTPRVPSKKEVESLLRLVDYRKVIIDESSSTVFLKDKGMEIGLGGIAKGVVVVLAILSAYSISVMIERWLTYRQARKQSRLFTPAVAECLKDGKIDEAIALGEQYNKSHLAKVLTSGLYELKGAPKGKEIPANTIDAARRALDRATAIGIEELKKELLLHVRKEIGAIAVPEVIQFAPALPKTRSGKIMRRILKALATGWRTVASMATVSKLTITPVLSFKSTSSEIVK